MMTYNNLSQELNTLAYNLQNTDTSLLCVGEETLQRSIINRLYYALFTRIIDEIPQLKASKTGDKHKQIEDRLKMHSQNATCNNAYRLFRDLKSLRVWADYEPTKNAPSSNLNNLLNKTYQVISYKKIFP